MRNPSFRSRRFVRDAHRFRGGCRAVNDTSRAQPDMIPAMDLLKLMHLYRPHERML
jgi:hypothetical protein